MIAFASCFPGSIKAFEIGPGREMVFQEKRIPCKRSRVELSVFFNKKFSSGLFGGEGFIMQKVSGQGTVFAEFDGHVVEYELNAGQENCRRYWTSGCNGCFMPDRDKECSWSKKYAVWRRGNL